MNVTYNLGPLLREAGFPDWKALIGAPASEVGGMLTGVAERLKANPDAYTRLLPDNGWGTMEWAVGFLEDFAAECASHPKATIGGWL